MSNDTNIGHNIQPVTALAQDRPMPLFFSRNLWNSLAFLVLAALWGGSYIGIKFAVLEFPPIFSAMIRLLIAQVVLFFILYFWKKIVPLPFKTLLKIWVIGLFPLGIPFAFLFWAERFISPGLAGILGGTTPLWILMISFIFLPHLISFSISKLFGLLLGLTGLCIIFWPMLTWGHLEDQILGSLAVLVMAICYAIGALLNQNILMGKEISSQSIVFHQNLSSTVFLLLLSPLLEKWPPLHVLMATKNFWFATLYLGIFSTAIAWMLYYYLIHQWGAMRASTATYAAPVAAIFWDFVFFHNRPHPSEFLGVAIILVSISLIQFSTKRNTDEGH